MTIEINRGESIESILEKLRSIDDSKLVFKHHVFRTRDVIELVFEEKE